MLGCQMKHYKNYSNSLSSKSYSGILSELPVLSKVFVQEVTTDTYTWPDAIQIKGSVCHSNGVDLVA